MNYSMISAQSFVIPPANLWEERLPSALTAAGPRSNKSGDAWLVGPDERSMGVVISASAVLGALKHSRLNPKSTLSFDQIPKAASDPAARLLAQNEDSVDAEVLYPYPQLMAAILSLDDQELQLACIDVYNRWVEEFCSVEPQRLIGLAQVPTTGIDSALRAVETVANGGKLRGVQLHEFPSGKSAPTGEDSQFWQRAVELGVAVTVDRKFGDFSVEPEPLLRGALFTQPEVATQLQMLLYSGILFEQPELRLIVAGVDAGWVPKWFEATDNNYMRTVAMRDYQLPDPDSMPSDYLRRHFCFTLGNVDTVAVRQRHYIGAGQVMWSSAFPRATSDWPDNRSGADRLTRELPADQCSALLAGNTARMYRLPGWEELQLDEQPAESLPHIVNA